MVSIPPSPVVGLFWFCRMHVSNQCKSTTLLSHPGHSPHTPWASRKHLPTPIPAPAVRELPSWGLLLLALILYDCHRNPWLGGATQTDGLTLPAVQTGTWEPAWPPVAPQLLGGGGAGAEPPWGPDTSFLSYSSPWPRSLRLSVLSYATDGRVTYFLSVPSQGPRDTVERCTTARSLSLFRSDCPRGPLGAGAPGLVL